jgi:hypothetical protein
MVTGALQSLAAEFIDSNPDLLGGLEPANDHTFCDVERSIDREPPNRIHDVYPFILPAAVIATKYRYTYNTMPRN